jgi:nicotinate-nucleotide pyrophosphorylase (carboxylating)
MLSQDTINEAVLRALQEDAPTGDITSETLIPESATATAQLRAREAGIFSGGQVFAAAFALVDPSVHIKVLVEDGARMEAGQLLAEVSGCARSVLRAERIGLNFAQRMSGIATLTAQYVDAIAGTNARILDTRKTTPGLRAFERAAVVAGGGVNHRLNLSDAVLAKDNHLAVLTAGGKDLATELQRVRAQVGPDIKIEVEVDRINQIAPVLAGGVDIIMLDNFTLDELREGVALVDGRAVVEASGNVRLDTVRAIAQTGVDVISVGALTHSARALDLGLDISLEVTAQ